MHISDGSGQWNEYTFGTELEHGPSAIAKANGTKLLEAVFLLQGLCAAFDLGEADLLGVTTDELPKVEFATLHYLHGDDLAVKTI